MLTMDIVKKSTGKTKSKKYWYLGVVALVVCISLLLTNRFRNVTYIASESSLLINTVQRGDLLVSINGYGKLTPSNISVIGASSDGLVRKVNVRAGDIVESGNVLLELENIQLMQEQQELELEVAALAADHTVNRVTRESQLLDLITEAANSEIDYQDVKLTLDAQDQLLSSGRAVVSRIEHEQSKLTVQKYYQRWEMQQARVEKHREVLVAANKAEAARLNQALGNLDRINEQVKDLSIKASFGGIVQEMSFSPGEQIRQGDVVTRIASPDDLIAEIKVQELQVNRIERGMLATVSTRNSTIRGRVTRIDPAVVESTVLVEIEITDELPREARPDLNIEGVVEIDNVPNAIYLRRPVFAEPFSTAALYILNDAGDIANRVVVEYGQASSSLIEVLEGLSVGDKVITSDPTDWLGHERILVR